MWCLTIVIRTVIIKSNSEWILYPDSAVLIRSRGERRALAPFYILIIDCFLYHFRTFLLGGGNIPCYGQYGHKPCSTRRSPFLCSEVRFRRIHLLHLYSCSSVSRYVTKNWSFSSRTNQIMQSVNALLLLTRAFFVSAENIQNHILFRLPCSVGSSSGAWGKV